MFTYNYFTARYVDLVDPLFDTFFNFLNILHKRNGQIPKF